MQEVDVQEVIGLGVPSVRSRGRVDLFLPFKLIDKAFKVCYTRKIIKFDRKQHHAMRPLPPAELVWMVGGSINKASLGGPPLMPARLILLLQIDMIGNGLHIVLQFARLGFYDWCFPSVCILPWPWASRICIKAGRGRVGVFYWMSRAKAPPVLETLHRLFSWLREITKTLKPAAMCKN